MHRLLALLSIRDCVWRREMPRSRIATSTLNVPSRLVEDEGSPWHARRQSFFAARRAPLLNAGRRYRRRFVRSKAIADTHKFRYKVWSLVAKQSQFVAVGTH